MPTVPNTPHAAPPREQQSYRHEAYLFAAREDFVAGLVPFVQDGLAAGEAVLLALVPEHAAWLEAELGPEASEVHVTDVVELGRNPARVIPRYLDFLEGSCGPGRPARAIAEPVWGGRSPAEVQENQLHEALLNLAVDPLLPFWLLCPYDATHLDVETVAEAGRSHPALVTATSYEGSGRYRGQEHARELFTADLPPPPAQAWRAGVTPTTLTEVVEQVTVRAASSLGSDGAVRLPDVVRGLADDALARGAGQVDVQLWDEHDQLVCQVSDHTVIEDFLVGRRLLPAAEQDAVTAAHRACDLVQVRSGDRGTTIRLHLTA